MPTTSQMLVDYSDILLQVLAELRGAFLDAADSREQAIELLAAQITDPTSVQMAYEEVGDYNPESRTAIELLLKEGGELAEAQFSRQFGGIRQMGPAKLEEIPVTEKYRSWVEECSQLFGGLDLLALDAIHTIDGEEYIIELNDSMFGFVIQYESEDMEDVKDLIIQKMNDQV